MAKKETRPSVELLRQRGKSKVWVASVGGEDIPLGTSDRSVADENLRALLAEQPEGRESRRPWRVYPLADRPGFAIKYYDRDGKRRLHRVPGGLPQPVTSIEQAEAYAASWYGKNVGFPSAGKGAGTPRRSGERLLSRSLTFREFGQMWTSGDLARRFPDHVNIKATASDDEQRLRLYVYPLIGRHPVSAFEGASGLELVETVLAGMPPVSSSFSRASRRQVLQAIHRLLTLAVFPARLLASHPLPKGFLPRPQPTRAKTYLFPDEDAKLMACVLVPLLARLFFGILSREGMRVSELHALTWERVDLERGVIYLDENKTDDVRSWALDAGVLEALRRWKERFASKAPPSALVVSDPRGGAIDRFEAARDLRRYLALAGVTRPQLYERTERRLPLRAHDLRATFVTVNLAQGKTEAWITDRTGHRSSQMIYAYKRAARTHEELHLGVLMPLNEAIPELRDAP